MACGDCQPHRVVRNHATVAAMPPRCPAQYCPAEGALQVGNTCAGARTAARRGAYLVVRRRSTRRRARGQGSDLPDKAGGKRRCVWKEGRVAIGGGRRGAAVSSCQGLARPWRGAIVRGTARTRSNLISETKQTGRQRRRGRAERLHHRLGRLGPGGQRLRPARPSRADLKNLLPNSCVPLAGAQLQLQASAARPSCDVGQHQAGCRIHVGQCVCGIGCRNEYQYSDKEECMKALKGTCSERRRASGWSGPAGGDLGPRP